MSGAVNRPDAALTDANLTERVRILEALAPGAALTPGWTPGTFVVCLGCQEVSEEFADCLDIPPNICTGVSEPLIPFLAEPEPIASISIGAYQCAYAAGFVVRGQFVGLDQRGAFYFGISRSPDPPSSGQWTAMGNETPLTLELVNTGSIAAEYDPTGDGTPDDLWTAWLGVTNGSIIDGQAYGSFCIEFESQSKKIDNLPQPQEAGAILVSVADVGSTFKWVALSPGTTGQVLTINGSGVPEWT